VIRVLCPVLFGGERARITHQGGGPSGDKPAGRRERDSRQRRVAERPDYRCFRGTIEHVSEKLGEVRERVRALLDRDPVRLGQGELQDMVRGAHEVAAMLAGLAARLTAELVARGAVDAAGEPTEVRDWLGEQLSADVGQARALLRRAERLGRLPQLAEALAAGQVGVEQADSVAQLIGVLPDDAHSDAETILVAGALAGGTPRQLALLLRQIRHRVDPDGTTDAALRREDEQNLHLCEFGDGSIAVRGKLDPLDGADVLATLRPLAEPHGEDDPRSPARRLADALVHLCRTHEEDPAREPRRPEIVVLTPPDVLSEEPAGDGAAAVLAESGAVLDDPAVRALACTSGMRRLVLVPASRPIGTAGIGGPLWSRWMQGLRGSLPAVLTGPSEVLDLGRSRRLASRAQWLALVARDSGCVLPGCHAPPSWCDVHHLLEWTADHGPTDLDNLALVCRRHHLDLHRRGQHLAFRADRGWIRTSTAAAPARLAG